MTRRKQKSPPVVLSIAGYDPSSGAGVTADIKTISAHGCYGISCITALTVQSTRGVKRVAPVAPKIIAETLAALSADIKIAAVKIGMLGSAEAASAVANFLRRTRPEICVLDPILKSSSGADLVSLKGLQLLRTRLLPLATVITPNLAEAAALTGIRVTGLKEMRAAALRLHSLGVPNVIITGGHMTTPVDLVSADHGDEFTLLSGRHVQTKSTHGTGCAFSTALACNLVSGMSLANAARKAKRFVHSALRHPPGIGKGTGPII